MNRILLLVIALLAYFSLAPRIQAERNVAGTVVLQDGSPAAGYRVRAFDADLVGADELMCETIVDASGHYSMTYRKGTWDGPKVGTAWRPDIYVVVAKPLEGGGWKRVDQSGVRSDWPVRDDITQDFRIPDDGECPATAKFKTTGVWRGCNCPIATYKRYLDLAHYEARCAVGSSPEAQCRTSGGTWVGWDNRYGQCVSEPDLPSAHRTLRREAYYAYMRHVSEKVSMQRLPTWVITRYQRYYPNVNLAELTIGESSNTPSPRTAITDCKKMYFPQKAQELPKIKTEAGPDYFWLLHEMTHTNQCMSLNPGTFSSKRDKYADMWFGNLPIPVLLSILEDGVPVDGAIHDKMPMEQDADRNAGQVINATHIGAVPTNDCPAGQFSTRDYRGCSCPAGKTKTYSGAFSESAQCN